MTALAARGLVGVFTSHHTLEVNGKTLHFKKAVVATGEFCSPALGGAPDPVLFR